MRRAGWVLIAALGGCAGGKGGNGYTAGAGGGGIGGFGGGFNDACLQPDADADGDGYTVARGDCLDCDPLVNPGAFDVAGSGVDEDCSGGLDDEPIDCDGSLAMDTTDPLDLAHAMGLCRIIDADATSWGVIDAALTQADGVTPTDPWLHGVLPDFGPNFPAAQGKQLAALASGTARRPIDRGSVDPNGFGYRNPSLESAYPPGFPKNAQGCPAPIEPTANDSVRLNLSIRVPTNAKAFSFDFNFLTAEYSEFVCSEYNDAFIALLNGSIPGPSEQDGNIAFDTQGQPIGVNSAFFILVDPNILEDTWMAHGLGGGTSWLHTTAPVAPGETIELSFAIWDTSDHSYDSFVLIDNWQWSLEAAEGPTTEPIE